MLLLEQGDIVDMEVMADKVLNTNKKESLACVHWYGNVNTPDKWKWDSVRYTVLAAESDALELWHAIQDDSEVILDLGCSVFPEEFNTLQNINTWKAVTMLPDETWAAMLAV
jgi:hypothetical protein